MNRRDMLLALAVAPLEHDAAVHTIDMDLIIHRRIRIPTISNPNLPEPQGGQSWLG